MNEQDDGILHPGMVSKPGKTRDVVILFVHLIVRFATECHISVMRMVQNKAKKRTKEEKSEYSGAW